MWKTGNVNKFFLTNLLLYLMTQGIPNPKNGGLLLGKQIQAVFLLLYLPGGNYLIRVISARDMNKNERRYYDEKG